MSATSVIRSRFLVGVNSVHSRSFWAWLNIVFNRIDEKRIKLVGPDRACGEWIVRNGGEVTFDGESATKDYNLLVAPPADVKKRLIAIDADNASITHHGFDHLRNCLHVERIKFNKCAYVSDEAMKKLMLVKGSLKDLHVSSCDEVTDKGVISLTGLSFTHETAYYNPLSALSYKLLMCREPQHERFAIVAVICADYPCLIFESTTGTPVRSH